MKTTIVEDYISIQKDILSDFAQSWDGEKSKTNFRDDVRQYYGFEKSFGWNIMLNAYYIIDDTELAKNSFNKFQLQGPSRHPDIGERYLRLYGLLNAIYQQQLAVINLMEVFKYPEKKKYSEKLRNTDIILLRNKIGAHSTNYRDILADSEHKFDVYEISRPDLQMDRVELVRNQNSIENCELLNAIRDFDQLIEGILCELTGKVIKKLFHNKGKMYARYQEINHKRNGDIKFGDIYIKFTGVKPPASGREINP